MKDAKERIELLVEDNVKLKAMNQKEIEMRNNFEDKMAGVFKEINEYKVKYLNSVILIT